MPSFHSVLGSFLKQKSKSPSCLWQFNVSFLCSSYKTNFLTWSRKKSPYPIFPHFQLILPYTRPPPLCSNSTGFFFQPFFLPCSLYPLVLQTWGSFSWNALIFFPHLVKPIPPSDLTSMVTSLESPLLTAITRTDPMWQTLLVPCSSLFLNLWLQFYIKYMLI